MDITKTGSQSYKDLQKENNADFDYTSNLEDIKKANKIVSNFKSPYDISTLPIDINSPSNNWGDSIYDEEVVNQEDYENLGDVRAYNQSAIEKVGAGIAKGAILAGTTFLDSTVGLAVGVGTAISSGNSSDIWNNEFSVALQDINKAAEEAIPNYYSEVEQNRDWHENIFTANFWGDSVIKNLGFTVGAFYGGIPYTGVLKGGMKLLPQAVKAGLAASKAPAIINAGIGSTISAFNEGRIQALTNSSDWYNLEKTKRDDKYQKDLKDIEHLNTPTTQEQYNIIKSSLDNHYINDMKEVSRARADMGNADLLTNTALLTIPNLIQFGKLYGNGFNTGKRISDIGKKVTEDGTEYFTKRTTKKGLTRAILNPLSESAEEMSQTISGNTWGNYASTDVTNYYKSKYNPEAELETLSTWNSFNEGLIEATNSDEFWQGAFTGFITGAMGMPRFRGFKNDNGGIQSPITLEGGIVGEFKDYKDKQTREQDISNYLNSRINNPELINYYTGITRHNKYKKDMETALNAGDNFEFKNAEHAQLISDISMFSNAGRLQDLKDIVDSTVDTSEEGINSVIEQTTSKETIDGKEVFVGPFVDSSGNPLDKEIIIKHLESNRKEVLNTIDQYSRITDEINSITGGILNDEQVDELVYIQSQIENWESRSKDMIDKLPSQIYDKLLASIYNVSNIENIKNTKQVNNILRKLSPKLLNDLKNDLIQSDLSSADKFKTLDLISDLNKIQKSRSIYSKKLSEYLQNPTKLEKDLSKAKESESNRREDIQTQNEIDKVTNADINTLVNDPSVDLNALEEAINSKSNLNEEDLEAIDKVIEAKKIQTDKQLLDKYIKDSNFDDAIKGDALRLLEGAISKAESEDNLLDLNSAVYNDIDSILSEEDISNFRELGFNDGEIETILNNRLDDAKTALSEVISKLEDNNNEVETMPRKIEVDNSINTEETGSDATEVIISAEPIIIEENSTPTITSYDVESNIFKEEKREYDDTPGKESYEYLKPTTSEYPIYNKERDDSRPYYEIAEAVGIYTAQQINRMKAVYNYLSDRKVFSRISSGLLKPKDKVHFVIDSTLNFTAGDIVILMADSQGNIIGDLLDESSPAFERQLGLKELVERIKNEYIEAGSPNIFTSKESTSVAKMMVGKVNYSEQRRTLNTINRSVDSKGNVKIHPFILGIAVSDGANSTILIEPGTRKTQELSKREKKTLPPLNAKKGQPYLLLKTGSNTKSYVPVPISTPTFSQENANTEFNKAVVSKLAELSSISKDNTSIGRYVNDLKSLLSFSKLNINTIENNIIEFKFQKNKDSDVETLYLDLTDSNFLNELVDSLEGIGIQISRRYINGSYNGKSYNEMLGELITTNLAEGTTTTYNDWFTLNPINKEGKEVKAVSPKSKIIVPTSNTVTINMNGVDVFIDTNTWKVTNKEGKEYKGIKTDLLKAETYVNIHYPNDNGIISTPWGHYNTATNNFESTSNTKPKKQRISKLASKSYKKIESIISGLDILDSTEDTAIELLNLINTIQDEVSRGHILTEEELGNIETIKKQIYDQFGLEITELRGSNYNDGMKTIPQFQTNLELPLGSQVITGVRKPQINKNGVMIQASEITVQQNLEDDYDSNSPQHSLVEDSSSVEEIQEGVQGEVVKTLGDDITSVITDLESQESIYNKVKKFLNNPKRKDMWEQLTEEQKSIIANTKGPKQRQLFTKLELAYTTSSKSFNTSILKGDVDTFLGTKGLNKEVSNDYDLIDVDKEIEWLNKVLPQISKDGALKVVNRIIETTSNGNTTLAWGQFKKGIITIFDKGAKGTLYHEAYHYVSQMLLSDTEYNDIMKAARDKWGNKSTLELEENLAESFREYVELEEIPIVNNIIKSFRYMKHILTNFLGKESIIDNLFYRIQTKQLANNSIKDNTKITDTLLRRKASTYTELSKYITYKYGKIYYDRNSAENALTLVEPDLRNYVTVIKRKGYNQFLIRVIPKYELQERQDIIDSTNKKEETVDINYIEESDMEYIRNQYDLNSEIYYREVRSYYSNKLKFQNLNAEQTQYLKNRNITEDMYNKYTDFQKEVLFKCMD